MIDEYLIKEIQSRDFFSIVDHYHDYDSIETELIIGSWPENEVFITILIPVYNHPIEFITRAIKSAVGQEADIEYKVLIIDDYPSGNKEVELYIRNHPDKHIIYYRNKRNMGVFANWNRGVLLSKSKWISLLHTDDFLKPNYLKTMVRIINDYANIDQIACPYMVLDYTKGEVDVLGARGPFCGKAVLRKVDYREYMYGMFTSVKGAVYRKDSLLKIGGFMNQGDGLGLDDYPLMMRYAYYFNTYYLDAVMYVNSWGFNDSLNTSHWYPELIANYYMWKCIEKKRLGLIRWAYSVKDKYNLIKRTKDYENGTSWVGKKIDIDYEELYRVCNVGNEHQSVFLSYIARGIVRIDQAIIKRKQKRYLVEIEM